MCVLVFLLMAALSPPLLGVGGSSKQLGGGNRGSGAGRISLEKNKNVYKNVTATPLTFARTHLGILGFFGEERKTLAHETMTEQQNGLGTHGLIQQKTIHDSPQHSVHSLRLL